MDKQTVVRDGMADIAKQIIKELPGNEVVTLSGPLGAGKTTLVQEVLKQMGLTEPVISPTYTYVNVYRLPSGITIYHFDLYRLNSADEFIASGFNEYLYQPNSYCFIEWPECIETLLTKGIIRVDLEHGPDDTRLYSVILN